MKHWRESEKLTGEIRAILAAGRRCALATVVKVEGSAYRRPGAKLLIRDDATIAGNVSGGCLEADLAEIAQNVMREGIARRVTYHTDGPGDELWGLGMGCSGTIHLHLAPVCVANFQSFADELAEKLAGDRPFTVFLALRTEPGSAPAFQITDGAAETMLVEDETGATFIESFVPPARLVVCGAGDDSIPLVSMAELAGFRVTVVDHRPALLTEDRFPVASKLVLARPEETVFEVEADSDSFVVLKTHSLAHDRGWYKKYASVPVRYLGLMGPRSRREQVLEDNPACWPGLHAPVGLDLGAEGAEQIALSIVGELLSEYHGRNGGKLRKRETSIHESATTSGSGGLPVSALGRL